MGMIRGDLEVLGISGLLQMLSANRREGFLTLRRDDRKKVVHLGAAGIRLVSGARRANPLGEILIRIGRLTRDELRSLLSEQRLTRRPLGELVTRRGILTSAQLETALREQLAEEIYELFTWEKATFSFVDAREARPPSNEGPLSTVLLDGNVMTHLLEAARRTDELAEIRTVIDEETRVKARGAAEKVPDVPEVDPDAVREILRLVDGRRTVRQVIEASVYPRFMVLRTLYELVVKGAVRVEDPGGSLLPEAWKPSTGTSRADARALRAQA